MSTATNLYEQDFYAWTQEQASRLRASQPAELDWERLAKEIEDMGSRFWMMEFGRNSRGVVN